MRTPAISLTSRFTLTATFITVSLAVAFLLVIRFIDDVEDAVHDKSIENINILSESSNITRELFQVSTRIQLLGKNITDNEETLLQEETLIEDKLKSIRSSSKNPDFIALVDIFIKDFNEFIKNSIVLNNTFKESNAINQKLNHKIYKLEESIRGQYNNSKNVKNSDLISNTSKARQSYLQAGRLSASIKSKRTPAEQKNTIEKTNNALNFTQQYLSNVTNINYKSRSLEIIHSINQQKEKLEKTQRHLTKRTESINALILSQDKLFKLFEKKEISAQDSIINLKDQLEHQLHQLRNTIAIVALLVVIISFTAFSRLVKQHIRLPIGQIIRGIEAFETGHSNKSLNLNREDEWNTIEKAFKNLNERLNESYSQLDDERKNFDYLAHHDPLTGLENRLFGYEKLGQLIEESSQNGKNFALLFLDLDQFKHVNDSLGHGVGDKLLQNIAITLKKIIGDAGFIIRLGGDEFMVIFPDTSDIYIIESYSMVINLSMNNPMDIDGHTVFVTSSIGICQYPDHGKDAETLIRNADTAMYQAKKEGRNRYRIYQNNMTLEALDLIKKSSGIRQAIEQEEFRLFYQLKLP